MTDSAQTSFTMGMLATISHILRLFFRILIAPAHFLLPVVLPRPNKSSSNYGFIEEVENDIHRRTISDTVCPAIQTPKNVFEILAYGRKESGNGPCVGFRRSKTAKYEWLSYQTVIDRATNFGAGLLTLGAKSDCEYLVGIMAKNCVDWTVAEFGCFAYGMATAPLSESLEPEPLHEVINHCDLEIMIISGNDQAAALLNGDSKKLRTVITTEPLNEKHISQLESQGVRVLTLAEVEKIGALNPQPLRLAPEHTLASLIFTSGTTGVPKGVMLTHYCIMMSAKSYSQTCHPMIFNAQDTVLSLYPLSHVFERSVEKFIHLSGGRVGYLTDGLKSLFKDAKDVQPTVFMFVPRIMNRFYDDVNAQLNKSFFGRTFARMALAAKYRNMEKGIFSSDTIWDLLLFRQFQAMLGGKVRGGATGSAAVEGKVLSFIRAVFGCYIFEMYGQSESCGPISSNVYGDSTTGHVGSPFVDVEVKLVDVPEMGYFAANQCGEICSRSPFTMKGYYRMTEKTAEALDEDGWLYTGDIGMWTEDGKLKVFDRKKHIFKLSQGEYLAPERLEGIFGRSTLITNIFIDGDSKYPYPVALVYPNYRALGLPSGHAVQNGLKSSQDSLVSEKVLEDLKRIGKEYKVKGYEVPKKIAILDEAFSLENNCLTASQKTKRDVVRNIHRDRLRQLYETE